MTPEFSEESTQEIPQGENGADSSYVKNSNNPEIQSRIESKQDFFSKEFHVDELRANRLARREVAGELLREREKNKRERTEQLLEDTERSGIELVFQNRRLQLENERITEESGFDDVTGILNRKGVLMKINGIEGVNEGIIKKTKKTGQNVFVAFFDGNKVKKVNDRFGHVAGDSYLRLMAQRLRSSFRELDTVGRWGGDEFVVILENISEEDAEKIVERAIKDVNDFVFSWEKDGNQEELNMSISGGLVTVEDIDHIEKALDQADQEMYAQKQAAQDHNDYKETLQRVDQELESYG